MLIKGEREHSITDPEPDVRVYDSRKWKLIKGGSISRDHDGWRRIWRPRWEWAKL